MVFTLDESPVPFFVLHVGKQRQGKIADVNQNIDVEFCLDLFTYLTYQGLRLFCNRLDLLIKINKDDLFVFGIGRACFFGEDGRLQGGDQNERVFYYLHCRLGHLLTGLDGV